MTRSAIDLFQTDKKERSTSSLKSPSNSQLILAISCTLPFYYVDLRLVATGYRAIQSTKPSIDAASSNNRAIIFLSILVPGDGGEPSEDSACNRLE